MTTRLAEIRRWSRNGFQVTGYVWNDPKDIYVNGEFICLTVNKEDWLDNNSYYLYTMSQYRIFMLMKDEEIA